MKFWQLVSVMRPDIASIRKVTSKKPEWHYVSGWLDEYGDIVTAKDRAKVDRELPDDLVRAVLRYSKARFYLSGDRRLRSRRHSFWDKSLSALRAFDRFGGGALEQALEHGSVSV